MKLKLSRVVLILWQVLSAVRKKFWLTVNSIKIQYIVEDKPTYTQTYYTCTLVFYFMFSTFVSSMLIFGSCMYHIYLYELLFIIKFIFVRHWTRSFLVSAKHVTYSYFCLTKCISIMTNYIVYRCIGINV